MSLSVEPETIERIDQSRPKFATRSKWAEALILDRLAEIDKNGVSEYFGSERLAGTRNATGVHT